MEIIVLTILLAFCASLTLLINYYRKLLSDGRREYPRDEIVQIPHFLWMEWSHLVKYDTTTSYIGVGLGALLAFLLSYMGGLYGAHYESYFFHSAILPGLWFLGLPFLKEQYLDELKLTTFWQNLIANDTPFFFGFTVMMMAKSLMVYGMYHALSFLWILTNVGISMTLLIYKLTQFEKAENTLSVRHPDRSEPPTENW